jgi:hypothetical protein
MVLRYSDDIVVEEYTWEWLKMYERNASSQKVL